MKCQECGKNEVTFLYEKNVNGHVTTMHLCSACAEKTGLAQRMNPRSMLEHMFGDNPWDHAFMPLPSLLGQMRGIMEDPFDDFFADMPAIGTERTEVTQKPQQELVDTAEQSRFSRLRQLNALRMEMKKAVRQENFERAAELRDQIRGLEGEQRL